MNGTPCLIHRDGDSDWCASCGLSWDANDPAPPICPRIPVPEPAYGAGLFRVHALMLTIVLMTFLVAWMSS